MQMQMQKQKHESASASESLSPLEQERYTCATICNLYRKGASAAESNEATKREA